MSSKCDLVNHAIICCGQLNDTDFGFQTAGKCISASGGFQNFPGGTALDPPWLSKALQTLHFSAQLSCPDARMLKNVLKTLLLANQCLDLA